MKMQNLMNNVLKETKINLIVTTVAKMQKKNNIALTILKKYTAEALLMQKAI